MSKYLWLIHIISKSLYKPLIILYFANIQSDIYIYIYIIMKTIFLFNFQDRVFRIIVLPIAVNR